MDRATTYFGKQRPWLLRARETLSRSSEVLKPINYMLRRGDDFAEALGRHDMGFDRAQQGIQQRTNRSHGIRDGRQRDRHTFQGVALSLAV